ncbi:PAS domain S-box protein [Xanthocytophaga agilis]|uniref:histidine kinase n=1 Tax=Xanthocytophaga agilis TaxID=3048010 RepID=A0AAE3UF15_9BACT|nr:PAS domain S-box protein [Xanthocytophaga agilis]MDJ1501931.1 PAS domain S-box protein [Xanthocytophaga agilis]
MIGQLELSRNIRLSFFVAAAMFVLVALINIWVVERKVQNRICDLNRVSLVAGQKLYVQTIAKDALLIQAATDPVMLERHVLQIQEDVGEWQSVNKKLQNQDVHSKRLGLLLSDPVSIGVSELYQKAEPRRKAMMKAVAQLVRTTQTSGPNHKAAVKKSVKSILKQEAYLRKEYDQICLQAIKDAEHNLYNLKKWILQTTLVTLVILLALGFLLLRPLKKIINNFLAYQKTQIKRLRIASEDLSRTNAFQKAILESAIVSIVATDEDGIITHVNTTAGAWLGYSSADLIGKCSPDIFHDSDELKQRAGQLSVIYGREITPGYEVLIAPLEYNSFDTREWTYVRKDGSTFPILLTVSPIRDEEGEITGYLGVGYDMTQKHKVEEKLRKSEEFYRLLSQNAKDVVCLHEPDGTYIYLSDAIVSLTGYLPDELVGKHPLTVVHLDDHAHIEEARRKSMDDGQGRLIQYRFKCKDGSYVWVETQVSLLKDEDGNLVHLQSSTRDISARKKFQEQLEHSEYNLQEAQRVARLGSWEIDLRTERTLWSLEMYRLHGMEPHSALPEINRFVHLIYPDDRRQFLANIHNARSLGKEFEWDLRVVLPDGTIRWLYTIVRVRKDDTGAVVKLYGTAMDITESKRAREELSESNRLINALFDHSPLPIQVFDKYGFSLRMNEARRSFLGLPSVGYRVGQYNVLTDEVSKATGLKAYYERAYNGEVVIVRDQYMDLTNKFGDESDLRRVYYDHLIFPLQNSNGVVEAVVSFIQDITDRIDAKQKAQHALRFVESVANATPDFLFVVDVEQQAVIYANYALQTFLGASNEELRGQEKSLLEQAVLPLDQPLVKQYLKEFPTEGTHSIEFHLRNIQNEYRLICTHGVPFQFDSDGKVTQILISAQDITDQRESDLRLWQAYRELKASEEELRSNGEELQAMNEAMEETIAELRSTQAQLIQSEKMASLGQLTAGIAHEINNPINFVYAGVDNLKQSLSEIYQILAHYERIEEVHNTEQITWELAAMKDIKQSLFYRENKENIWLTLQSIEQGASRTAEIVKGLRMFSRLDEAESKFANINECLDSTLILLTGQTKNRIQVIREYDKTLPEIECYPGQLNQVFMNLLTNAIQAIDGVGLIWVETKNEDDTIVISVRDSGLGMSDETRNKIFDPFFTTKPVGQGTGLGLSITYSIIQKHQGIVEVESELGHGTTFVVRLPKVMKLQEVH